MRWLELSRRRRAYCVELYRSGRWTLHYTEASLHDHMLEVIADVERWEAVVATCE
jgi:hypothetical protein